MPKRKVKAPEPPVVQGPPPPPPGVAKVIPEHCFVVGTSGYMFSTGCPDEFYYGGPTDEGRDAAKASAEAEMAWRKNLAPSLGFYVSTLSDYLSRMQSDARQDGYEDGSTSARGY